MAEEANAAEEKSGKTASKRSMRHDKLWCKECSETGCTACGWWIRASKGTQTFCRCCHNRAWQAPSQREEASLFAARQSAIDAQNAVENERGQSQDQPPRCSRRSLTVVREGSVALEQEDETQEEIESPEAEVRTDQADKEEEMVSPILDLKGTKVEEQECGSDPEEPQPDRSPPHHPPQQSPTRSDRSRTQDAPDSKKSRRRRPHPRHRSVQARGAQPDKRRRPRTPPRPVQAQGAQLSQNRRPRTPPRPPVQGGMSQAELEVRTNLRIKERRNRFMARHEEEGATEEEQHQGQAEHSRAAARSGRPARLRPRREEEKDNAMAHPVSLRSPSRKRRSREPSQAGHRGAHARHSDCSRSPPASHRRRRRESADMELAQSMAALQQEEQAVQSQVAASLATWLSQQPTWTPPVQEDRV